MDKNSFLYEVVKRDVDIRKANEAKEEEKKKPLKDWLANTGIIFIDFNFNPSHKTGQRAIEAVLDRAVSRKANPDGTLSS
jgi:hypothetical protein